MMIYLSVFISTLVSSSKALSISTLHFCLHICTSYISLYSTPFFGLHQNVYVLNSTILSISNFLSTFLPVFIRLYPPVLILLLNFSLLPLPHLFHSTKHDTFILLDKCTVVVCVQTIYIYIWQRRDHNQA